MKRYKDCHAADVVPFTAKWPHAYPVRNPHGSPLATLLPPCWPYFNPLARLPTSPLPIYPAWLPSPAFTPHLEEVPRCTRLALLCLQEGPGLQGGRVRGEEGVEGRGRRKRGEKG